MKDVRTNNDCLLYSVNNDCLLYCVNNDCLLYDVKVFFYTSFSLFSKLENGEGGGGGGEWKLRHPTGCL